MAILMLTLKGKLIQEYKLDGGPRLTIGRGLNNDIIIQHPSVSRKHAEIEFREGGYLLVDLESKNGTFVNRERVQSRWLENGLLFRIGNHHLLYVEDGDAAAPEVQAESEGRMESKGELESATIAVDLQTQTDIVDTGMSAREPAVPAEGFLTFLAGGEGEVAITPRGLSVGRDPSCDIKLGSRLVGKTAFTIERKPIGYYLSYVGGISLPKVSGQPVRQSMKLEEFDIIEIGSTKLLYFTVQATLHSAAGRRISYRKATSLPGIYTTPDNMPHKMLVVSLSIGGLGFEAIDEVSVEKGDILRVQFTLDDENRSVIRSSVVVRRVSNNSLGCSFADLSKRVRKDLQAYLDPQCC
jgi:pSer/pThr/pTyr-binding forkhead associated (FHA) protein